MWMEELDDDRAYPFRTDNARPFNKVVPEFTATKEMPKDKRGFQCDCTARNDFGIHRRCLSSSNHPTTFSFHEDKGR